MELNLIMLDNDEIRTLRAPLNALVALKRASGNYGLITTYLRGLVPLKMHFLSNLEEELLSFGVEKGVSQVHKGIASCGLLDRVTSLHDLLKISNLGGTEKMVFVELMAIEDSGTKLGLLLRGG
jgi:hypothetical protein